MRTQPVSLGVVNFAAEGNSVEKEKALTEVNNTPQDKGKGKATLPLVSAAIAIASLGVALSKRKPQKTGELDELVKVLKEELDKLKQAQEKEGVPDKVREMISAVSEEVEKLKQQGNIDGLRKLLSDLDSKINLTKDFFTETIEVNGRYMNLATTLNSVTGEARTTMENTLRTESARRMLGCVPKLGTIPKGGIIRIPTSEYKGIASTGGLAIVPKEIAENLSRMIAGRQDLQVVVDIPMYRGLVERTGANGTSKTCYNRLSRNSDGTYRYFQVRDEIENGVASRKEQVLADKLQKIDTMNLKIKTDSRIEDTIVDVFMGETRLELKSLEPEKEFSAEVLNLINDFKANGDPGTSKRFGALEIFKGTDGEIKYYTNVKTILYDNGIDGKFDLNVPTSNASNIYNDRAIAAGETERFTYFSKFFYEQLLKSDEASGSLRADLIIGNDWQTGPISAMIRQLTTVRKAYGLSPDIADKVYNTPILTIMHNAALSGGVWHSQEKLLNIMFGEHAAEIVKNSHMPNLEIIGKTGGLSGGLFNGLMDGSGINPQMMAVAYSDYIIPVSQGYSREIATSDTLGHARRKLYEFRAREGAYSDVNNLKLIANNSGVSPDLVVSAKPTMLGITNGSDKANNTLTQKVANELAKKLDLPIGTFKSYSPELDPLEWHNANKKAAIAKIKRDIDLARESGGKNNPMLIEMPMETDLTGVTENTPVFVCAGRIVEQKGLDILAQSIMDFYKNFKGKDYPVFYIQGIGDNRYNQAIIDVKKQLAKENSDAAKRIVFANLFSEPGRFDCAKLVADFSMCPSWFEPCGLAHKEIGLYSGAGAVVTRTGGLTEGLREGVNCFSSDFAPEKDRLMDNAANYAKAIQEAVNVHSDKNKYREVVKSMLDANFDWAREGGPIYEYTRLFEELGVLNHEAATAKITR